MKIVYCIAGTANPGGMERVLARKANWLASNGYKVVIITTDQRGRAPFFKLDASIECHDLDINYEDNNGKSFLNKIIHYPVKQYRHKKRLTALLQALKADIVISMFNNDASFIPSIQDGSRKLLEIHFSRYKRLQYGRKGLWALADKIRSQNDLKIASKFEKFIVLTEEDKGYWEGLNNIQVIPNPRTFDTNATATLKNKTVLAVGRYTYQKGYDTLIDIWEKVHADMPDWKLEIVGDGELRAQMEAQIRQAGLEDSIVLGKATSGILDKYLNASILVMTSRYEGLPMVLLEAQACGLPVVSFKCKCGPKDVIKDGQTGYLIEEGDNSSFVKKLKQLMSDQELRQEMGLKAKNNSENYTVDKIMSQWTNLFNNKKTLLQINPVINISTATGRIMQTIGETAIEHGWDSYIAFGGGRDSISTTSEDNVPRYHSNLIPIGNRLSVFIHGLATRLADRHGLASKRATAQFLRELDRIRPSVVQIHNIHGYFLNYKMLFNYLAEHNIPVVWTTHDCWLYTGHCYHYISEGCDKWQTGCNHCPLKHSFPTSWLLDRSAANYRDKKAVFTSLPNGNLHIVAVSQWMANEVRRSFLRDSDIRTISNGVNTKIFRRYTAEAVQIREKYNIRNKFLAVGCASIWSKNKGYDDYIKLASKVDDDTVIIMIGLTDKQISHLPSNIIGIPKTDNMRELAYLYSAADAVLNLSTEETMGLTTVEGMACGTPSIVYNCTASPELVTAETGYIVESHDIQGIIDAMHKIKTSCRELTIKACRTRVLEHYDEKKQFMKYIELYNSI